MRNRECMHHILILNTWGSWKPNIHCYKPSAVETMTLLQTLGRRIQQHCCKPSAVEPRHCYGFSAMIPFCGTFPKDSKSTALGLLGYIYIYIDLQLCIYICVYIYMCVCVRFCLAFDNKLWFRRKSCRWCDGRPEQGYEYDIFRTLRDYSGANPK